MNTDDLDEAIKCNRMVERYRLACIEWIRHAVSVEKRPSIETVAMALILSSEAVRLSFFLFFFVFSFVLVFEMSLHSSS